MDYLLLNLTPSTIFLIRVHHELFQVSNLKAKSIFLRISALMTFACFGRHVKPFKIIDISIKKVTALGPLEHLWPRAPKRLE